MSAYQCWLTQKERLREALQASGDTANAASLTRHTLAQVEQNVMAEQPDDLLRQQTGILFSCFRTSLNLLDISITTKVWVAQTQAEKPKARPASWWLLPACAAQLAAGLIAYLKNMPLIWMPLAAALVLTLVGWFALRRSPREAEPAEDRLKVTAKPDTEKLFQSIDAQMKAIDRYVNDFAYLNEQNALRNSTPGWKNVAALAELMEAVYECDGEAGQEAAATAERLLSGMGARAVPYSAADAGLFNVLPSITETRTLVPALVSLKDGALLYRGTAAALTAENTAAAAVAPPAADGAEPAEL